MKRIYMKYVFALLVSLLISLACFSQTNTGGIKKRTSSSKTTSIKNSATKTSTKKPYINKSNITQSQLPSDKPLFDMSNIIQKYECKEYIVFLENKGSVYGFNKNTHKYFIVNSSTKRVVSNVSFFDSSKGILKMRAGSDVLFYDLSTGSTSMAPRLSNMTYHIKLKKGVDALRIIVDEYYNGNSKNLTREEADACISRYNYCRKIVDDFEVAFDFYYGLNSRGITADEAKLRLQDAAAKGHEDAKTIFSELF